VTLLSGARNKKDRYLAEKTFNRIQQHSLHDKSQFVPAMVLLSNVYASIGDLQKSLNIKRQLSQLGLKKKIGLSWTETGGKIFVSDFIYIVVKR
jgi:hypothetical protein